jgi:very-short-patch-repair endonuclease/predicted transcriptional regulator of viral defense system
VAQILGAMKVTQVSDLARLTGVVTTAELHSAGLSKAGIAALVRTGELIALVRGVYIDAAAAARIGQIPRGPLAIRALGVLATAEPGAVISHHTAAQLHGLDLFAVSEEVSITRAAGAGSRSGKAGVHVHAARLPAGHVTLRLAVPVTTVARTVVDLGRTGEFREGVVVADSALHRQQTSKCALERVVAELPRCHGIRQASAAISFADARAESVLESIARVAFRDYGLPPPRLQVELGGSDFRARVDFYWPEFRTVAEVDGAMKYDDRSAAMRQLRRDANLRRAGFQVEHFSWQEITGDPERVAETIRAAFAEGLARRQLA